MNNNNVAPQTINLSPDALKKAEEMGLRAACIESQLEGLCRQLYQAFTQQSAVQRFPMMKAMSDRIGLLMYELEGIVTAHKEMMDHAREEEVVPEEEIVN